MYSRLSVAVQYSSYSTVVVRPALWYKVPKIKDLYPVPGKHYTADRQPADTLTAAAVDGPGNVPDNGVASTTTAAAALALVF